ERINRGCVYLYECLARAGLRHCFRTNCQRLHRRTALLDYDRVHLRDACGGHSGLLSSKWLAYRVAPSDVSAHRMLDAVWALSSLRRRTKAGRTSCSGEVSHGVAWASVSWRLVARVPIVAAAMMARRTNPPAARKAAWKPSVSAWLIG